MTKPITLAGPYYNPADLTLGQRIHAVAHQQFYYTTDSHKKFERKQLSHPLEVVVVNCVKKATGKHEFAKQFGLDDYEQAKLVVDKYHWFYQVRSQFRKPTMLVLEEDLMTKFHDFNGYSYNYRGVHIWSHANGTRASFHYEGTRYDDITLTEATSKITELTDAKAKATQSSL